MSPRRVLLLSCALLVSGCLWPVRDRTDQAVAELAARPLDPQPAPLMPRAVGSLSKPGAAPATVLPAADVQTSALMQDQPRPRLELEIPPQVPGSETPL